MATELGTILRRDIVGGRAGGMVTLKMLLSTFRSHFWYESHEKDEENMRNRVFVICTEAQGGCVDRERDVRSVFPFFISFEKYAKTQFYNCSFVKWPMVMWVFWYRIVRANFCSESEIQKKSIRWQSDWKKAGNSEWKDMKCWLRKPFHQQSKSSSPHNSCDLMACYVVVDIHIHV